MLLPSIVMAAGLVASVVAAPADTGATVPDSAGQAAAFMYPNSQENTVSGSADQGAVLDDLSGEGSQLDDSASDSGSVPSSGARSSPALGASTDSATSGSSAQTVSDDSASMGGSLGNSFPALSGGYCVGKAPPFVLTDTNRYEVFGPKTDHRRVIIHLYFPTKKVDNKCPTGEAYASEGYAGWLVNFLNPAGTSTFTKDYFKNFKTNSRTGGNLYCGQTGKSNYKRQEEETDLETSSATDDETLAGASALKEDATASDTSALDASATKADATALDASVAEGGKPNPADCKCPVLLFSHGFNVPFQLNKALVEDVASNGNIVVGIEHLYDSDYAEVPDSNPPEVVRTPSIFFEQPEIYTLGRINVEVRSNDTLFVLDQIKKGNVKIPNYGSIASLASTVRMFGHSLGGQLSLVAMLRTPLITAGINMDGWFWNAANATAQNPPSKANAGDDRAYMTLRQDPKLLDPFSLVTGGGPQNYVDAMKVQTGPKIMPLVTGSLHFSYTDLTALSIPARGAQRDAFQVKTGPVNPQTMHQIYTGFTNWFFENTRSITKPATHDKIRAGYGSFREVFYDRTIY